MASGGGGRQAPTSYSASKTNRWILDLTKELAEDFTKFASGIGFTDEQIELKTDDDEGFDAQMMEQWLHTIGQHTTKHQYIIFTALEKLGRKDLLAKYFSSGAPEKCSDIWEDFLSDLHKIDFSMWHRGHEDKSKAITKKKKDRRKRNAKQGIVHQTNIYADRVVLGDNNIVVEEATPATDVRDKKIKHRLHDILKSNGAVGGNSDNTMNLQKLECCYHQRHGKGFKHEYGHSLLTYLQESGSVFVLKQSADQWYVHMRTPKPGFLAPASHENPLKCSISNYPPNVASSDSYNSQPTLIHSQQRLKRERLPNKCTEFNDFLKFVDNFRGGSYLLLISKTDLGKNIDALANIHWLCVFDFDVESRQNGLFYRVEDVLRKHRNGLYPCTWFDPPNVESFATEWCFVSGLRQEPESKTPDSFKEWYPHIKNKFKQHVEEINRKLDGVSILTVVAFWPEDTTTGMKFQKIISELHESVQPLPKVVVIGHPPAEQQTLVQMISPDYHLQEKHDHVFHDLSTNLAPLQEGMKYRLPTDDGSTTTQINDTLAASFRESMQILYLENPFPNTASDLSASEEEERLFLKGGTLSWQSYYINGPEHFYAKRDLLPTIVNDIKDKYIDPLKSGFVKIFHAPGAGGTTLGQNILWELHAITPCVQIRTDSLANPRQIVENIFTLYRETHSPIVVLFDGSDKNKFEHIQQQLQHVLVVFIYIERVTEKKPVQNENEYFLTGSLSTAEVRRMGPKFIRCCQNNVKKKDLIQRLADEVEKGVKHHLVEFGLVIHLDEYKGVDRYVAEYLKINRETKELSKNQRVLGYLSLVQFYGQGTMPCQMFGTMLGKSLDFKYTYAKFPDYVKEFTVPVESEFVQNSVRICHFLIAREILDQILTRTVSGTRGMDLSQAAKQHLQPFVLEFINTLKTRQNQARHLSKTLLDIIIQTFIYRESGADDTHPIKRQFSRLIESIPSEQPFTERLHVMEELATSFPVIPSLWAHLGRAYSLLCPAQHEKTETYFQEAIKGCKETESQTDSENEDNTLSFVYHMYGMFYLLRIKAEIAKCRTNKYSEMQFQEKIRKMFSLSNSACIAFSDCRLHGFAGNQESFGCIGEINVRLCICDLLKSHYQFNTILGLREKSQNADIVQFAEESLTAIQNLIMRCFNTVDQSQIDEQFYRIVPKYKILFKGMDQTKYVDTLNIPDTFHTRCVRIAGLKMMYGDGDRLGTIGGIKSESHIKLVVELLEKNIDDIRQQREKYPNLDVDFVFIDWIQAIRNPQQKRQYSLEQVLTNVRLWYNTLHSPYSVFYLFVLLFTISIHPERPFDASILTEAMSIKKGEFSKKRIGKKFSNQEKPREWLGKGNGIRCIEQGITFQQYIEGRVVNDEAASFTLAVLTGTIRPPNKLRQRGSVNLYIDGNDAEHVKIPFCPWKTNENLVGTVHVGCRVEFILAFTAQFGFEAYNVKLLNKTKCQHCGENVEILSIERHRMCMCGEMVERESQQNRPHTTANNKELDI